VIDSGTITIIKITRAKEREKKKKEKKRTLPTSDERESVKDIGRKKGMLRTIRIYSSTTLKKRKSF
jgi:hypothetical protein